MTDPMMYAASINRNLYIAPSIFSQTVTSSSVESFSCFPPEGRSATEPAGQVELSSESLGPMGTLGGWWWHGMWKSLGSPKRSPGRLPPAVTAQPKPDPALRTCSSASQLFWQVCPLQIWHQVKMHLKGCGWSYKSWALPMPGHASDVRLNLAGFLVPKWRHGSRKGRFGSGPSCDQWSTTHNQPKVAHHSTLPR